MSKRKRVTHNEGCDVDMTPMIDVVFQLIIFFIVTIKLNEQINEDIELAEAKESPTLKDAIDLMLIIEVDKSGYFSISGTPIPEGTIRQIIRNRYNRYGEFPVMIRADKRTQHKHVRKIMDMCSQIGIWRIDFAAIKKYAKE
jgi:biopolymer transport protein ExbD